MTWHEREYDRVVLSPPEPKIVGQCEECGYEIGEDETHVIVDGSSVLCEEKECFVSHAQKVLNVETINL